MTCQFCGGEIPNGSAFCTKCGKPVETMVSVEEKKESLSASLPVTDSAPKSSSGKEKSKSLIAPLVTLIAAISGWVYIFFSNTIEGVKAWFTSSEDLQNNLSQNYNYYGNNGGQSDTLSYVILFGVMALFTILAIVGIVWLVKRLLRKFGIKK